MDMQHNFREGMSRLGAAVTVLTTDGPAGRHGMTASAVTSVTDTPPTLLVCVNQSNRSHDIFRTNGTLCVNVLSAEHRDLSGLFARPGEEDRFAGDMWTTASTGAPVLRDALASFDGRIVETQSVGTHTVMFVQLEQILLPDATADGLMWFARSFHNLRVAS